MKKLKLSLSIFHKTKPTYRQKTTYDKQKLFSSFCLKSSRLKCDIIELQNWIQDMRDIHLHISSTLQNSAFQLSFLKLINEMSTGFQVSRAQST